MVLGRDFKALGVIRRLGQRGVMPGYGKRWIRMAARISQIAHYTPRFKEAYA
jgi:hypothetical protein